MDYVCIKKLSLGGRDYYPGESIPESAFLSGRADKLKACGYIAKAEEPGGTVLDCPDDPPVFRITLERDEQNGNTAYPITESQLQRVADILRMTAAEAADAINETDETVTAFIHALDSRKTVREVAKKRLDGQQ